MNLLNIGLRGQCICIGLASGLRLENIVVFYSFLCIHNQS